MKKSDVNTLVPPFEETKTELPSISELRLLKPHGAPLNVAGLFAGIGGVELGLERAGHKSSVLCEIEQGAAAVLKDI